MKPQDIAHFRILNQKIEDSPFKKPEDVVAHLGAMQAQDYPASLWAIALRTPGATKETVEKAIMQRKIVRTWPMRGTLHFVAADDVRWMLQLMTPRILQNMMGRERQLGLTDAIFAKSRKVIIKALEGGKELTRAQMYEVLERAKLPHKEYRGLHIIGRLSQEGLLCFGPHQAKQPTFVLLDEYIPKSKELNREASLAELAQRYFTGHGPAQIQDFVWWSGLKVSEAKLGIELTGKKLAHEVIEEKIYYFSPKIPSLKPSSDVHLLPSFDEYLVGYRDRSAVLDLSHAQKVVPGANGMFSPVIVINGKIRGLWKRVFKKDSIVITATPFVKFTKKDLDAIRVAGERYGKFLKLPVVVS